MAAFQKLTPGTLTLGPVIAAALAQQAAVASFPLGAASRRHLVRPVSGDAVGRAGRGRDREASSC